jgi:hypothetical protein
MLNATLGLCLLGRFRESGMRGDEGLRQQVRQQLLQHQPMPTPWRLQVDPEEFEELELHSSIKSVLSLLDAVPLLDDVPQHQVPRQSMQLCVTSRCCSALCCTCRPSAGLAASAHAGHLLVWLQVHDARPCQR